MLSRTTKRFIAISSISLMLIIFGCALNVAQMNPNPNILLNKSTKKIALVISKSIEDSFDFGPSGGVRGGSVENWHASLKNGFTNGFQDFFTIVNNAADADLILYIKRTDVAFAANSILVNQYGANYGAGSALAQITFSALLTSAQGNNIGKVAETAVSKKSITMAAEATMSVKDAVESMYEIIAKRMF